jgi:tetratricopeptide (TPR) repeat protein
MGVLLAGLLGLICCQTPSAESGRGESAPQERGSLEGLLERTRAQRAELQRNLAEQLAPLLQKLEVGPAPMPGAQRAALLDAIVALGEDVAPLLVDQLGVAEGAPAVARERADLCADALARLDLASVTGPILALLERAAPASAQRILRTLERGKPDPRVLTALRSALRGEQAELRKAALRALLILEPANVAFVNDLMAKGEAASIEVALATWSEAANASPAPAVRALLADTARACAHAERLLEYFRALPTLVGPREGVQLAALAGSSVLQRNLRVQILDSLRGFDLALTPELKKALEPLREPGDPLLREAALLALAALGDRQARREALEPYDAGVENNSRQSAVWMQRAEIHLRMNDADAALKDLQEALKLAKNESSIKPDLAIAFARAYARKGRFKDTAEWLRRAPVTSAKLRELSSGREFEEFRRSKPGQELFGSG